MQKRGIFVKRVLSLCLVFALLTGLCSAFAALEPGDARAVVGADISEEQRRDVYRSFDLEPGGATELTVTNAEERQYLSGLVSDSVIGTRSISCVYVEILTAGEGLQIDVSNISWCSREMYINALVTAGIDDAKLMVSSPVAGVSGTAALTGIYKAYEDMSGETLNEFAKLVGTQELVLTAELADEIGSYDAVAIVNELKLILDETKNMTDAQLRETINGLAQDYNVSLTEGQKDQLIQLCRSLEGLSSEELKAKVEQVQQTIKKLATAQETAIGIIQSVKDFFVAVGDFLTNLWNRLRGNA